MHELDIERHSRFPVATAVHDERCAYIASQYRMTAIDTDGLHVVWNRDFVNGGAPVSCHRCIQHGLRYAPRLYASLNLVAHLTLRPDGGMSVHAIQPETGELVWDRIIMLPEPAEWTEPVPVAVNALTEELSANFLGRNDRVVVALRRHSRRSEIWTADGHYPLPPLRGQTEFYEFEAESGVPKRLITIEGAFIGFHEIDSFDGLFRRGPEICKVDWDSGAVHTLITLDHRVVSICRVRELVYAAWNEGTRVGVCSFRVSEPGNVREHILRHKQVKDVVLYGKDDRAFLRINQTRLIRLNEDGSPDLALRIPPYLYYLIATSGDALFIGCSGRGANLLAFSTKSGDLIFQLKASGSLEAIALGATGIVAVMINNTLILYDRNAVEIGRVPCTMVGRSGCARTVAVCGSRVVQVMDPNEPEGPHKVRVIDVDPTRIQ